MSTITFQKALERLVSDNDYRIAVSADGSKLSSDYQLDDTEMKVMKLIGIKSGWVADDIVLDNVNCCCCCCP